MLKNFLVISLFLIFSLLFQDNGSFYENGNYKNFLISMLSDFDFNIVNLLDANTAWMISKTGYYPGIHSEAQTPFLFLSYLLEKVAFAGLMVGNKIKFHLGFTLLNLLSISMGFYFISKTLEYLKIRVSLLVLLIFYFSSSLFFFSSYMITVFDVLGFMLFAYLIYVLVEHETLNRSFNLLTAICVGSSLALLSICKVVNIPLLVPFVVFGLTMKNARKSLVYLVTSFSFVIMLEFINQHVKFGQLVSMNTAMSYIMGFDLNDIFYSVVYGYFGKAGYFTINLIFLFGLVGLILFLRKHSRAENRYRIYAFFFFLVLISNFASSIGFYGSVIEDHLPGRMVISALPLLILGFAYLMQGFARKAQIAVGIVLILLYQYFLISFIYLDYLDSYSFPKSAWLNLEEFTRAVEFIVSDRILSNFSSLPFDYILRILLLALLIAVAVRFLFKDGKVLSKSFESFIVSGTVILAIMTVLNYSYRSQKVIHLKSMGRLANKSIALKPNAIMADYVIDFANTQIQNSDESLKPLIEKGLQDYFESLKDGAFVIRNETTRKLIEEHSKDLSFWIKKQNSGK